MIEGSQPLLEVIDLETGYGKKPVLLGVSLEVGPGEVIAVIGPNGAGKSTILKAICGLIPVWKGDVRFDGAPTDGATPAQNVARGITLCPQGNRVFADMTVLENLEVGGLLLPRRESRERVNEALTMFPSLKDRTRQIAGRLSGGEQQMVALARALIPRPRLLMLDEPSLGLAPGVVKDVFGKLVAVNRETGTAILIVEQKVREVLAVCQRVYGIKLGRLAFTGSPDQLRDDKEKLRQLFL